VAASLHISRSGNWLDVGTTALAWTAQSGAGAGDLAQTALVARGAAAWTGRARWVRTVLQGALWGDGLGTAGWAGREGSLSTMDL
jgi:hypothetical protein